jgi:DNA-binding response OmpR family regulator
LCHTEPGFAKRGSELLRSHLARLLSAHYRIEAVADGEAALRAVARRMPSLVLSDVMMPRMDGIELLSRLRAEPRTAAVPMILLSARAGEKAKIEGLDAGADDYLIKPFSARELLARVEAHLKIALLAHVGIIVRQQDERALRVRKRALIRRQGIIDDRILNFSGQPSKGLFDER